MSADSQVRAETRDRNPWSDVPVFVSMFAGVTCGGQIRLETTYRNVADDLPTAGGGPSSNAGGRTRPETMYGQPASDAPGTVPVTTKNW